MFEKQKESSMIVLIRHTITQDHGHGECRLEMDLQEELMEIKLYV